MREDTVQVNKNTNYDKDSIYAFERFKKNCEYIELHGHTVIKYNNYYIVDFKSINKVNKATEAKKKNRKYK